MTYGTRVKIDAVRQLAYTALSTSFTALGGPTTTHTRIFRLVNTTNTDVYISVDGVTNNFRLASGSFLLLDLSTNRIQDDGLFLMVGTQFYVATVTGSAASGNVWLEILSGAGGT
jgi:hypothetical protein